MEQSENNPNPIAGEPALMKALEVVSQLIDQHSFPEDWEVDESAYSDDLITLQEKIVEAMDAIRSEAEERHHDDGPDDGDCIDDEAEQMPADYWHGEMKAEADAERQADAAHELAAELASGDWDGWY